MNLINRNAIYLAYFALLTCLLAVLVKFDGTVIVQVTPLGLKVQVHNHPAGCLIHPENMKLQPIDSGLA